MHIHSVAFAALGPFAGEHRIDFDDLGGSALFLIDGPTGAGKSTIIDAVVFALFGDVAGRTSDRQRLRSSFAPADTVSFAEVEFSTSFGRYRVHRTPEYARAKLRGSGTTTTPSTVLLSRSTGPQGWEPVSRNKGEADVEIQRVIGLSRAQFLQTVVLPQGEFANFLSAESKDRLAVLERIFATDVYSRIEATLEDQRRAAQGARDDAQHAVTVSVQHVLSRLSDEELRDVPQAPADDDPAGLISWLTAISDQVAHRLAAQQASVAGLDADVARLDEQLAALRARTVARGRVADAGSALAACSARRDHATASLVQHERTITSAGADSAEPEAAIVAVDTLLGSLGHALEAEQRLAGERSGVAALEAELGTVDGAIANLTQERDHELPSRLLALSTALAEAIAAARATAQAAADREGALLQSRLDGMAGELAARLADAQPCPVCGSAEHPAPAESVDATITAADIDRAGAQRTEAERAQHDLEVEHARLLAIGADVAVPADDAPDRRTIPDAVDVVADGIRRFQARVSTVDAELGQGRQRRAAIAAQLAEARRVADERAAEVEGALDGHPSIGARVASLRSARATLTAMAAANQAHADAARALADAEEALAALEDAESAVSADAADADRLVAHRDEVAAALRAAISARDALVTLSGDLVARITGVEAALRDRDDTRVRTADVISLANLVRGAEGNALAQPLSAYVVQTMFDEILVAANRRLRSMLDGRFELKATEQRTGRALTGLGLGLEVVDLRSDSVRKTSTLSGGETFCASLALALGLADTVRAHAGGIDIGMLFIDEGFGSLDGDRLDDVMAELLRLRSDGRTVGVISHVAEMKKSIMERIDVRPLGGRLGSTLSVSWSD